MKRWPKIAIIVFILLFVLSIMTSKTEVVQLDHSSGVSVQIVHEKKLFFIHSFQLKVHNGTDETILVQEPISSFTIQPGGSFSLADNTDIRESVAAGTSLAGHKETIWRFAKTFKITVAIPVEVNGQQQVIELSERVGD